MTSGRLIWVGKENRRDPEVALCSRYMERIRPYMKMDQQIIKPYQTGPAEVVRNREGEKVLGLLQDRDFLVVCDERGEQKSSKQLSSFIAAQRHKGVPRMLWLIGGSMGVGDAVRGRADCLLSLTKMTLPHALARALLLEQIYRALTIDAGHPYHHEG